MIEPKDADWESATIVEPKVYRELAAAGSVQGACIRPAGDDTGLVIVLRIGNQNRVLGRKVGGPRYFQSFDGAASVLAQAGITEWSASSEGWTPRTVKYQQGLMEKRDKAAQATK
ncbi:conserved hypothetical protein [Xanthomonas citri pv. citri]|nr:hypothetical protein Xazr_19860 [Xanthomonas campestris pv. azadirachtae]CEE60317.1 conserved hypothetical protein [Xanthomonas citri pv. citri]